jgi:hypothetical protein
MKRTNRIFGLAALVAIFAVPTIAQQKCTDDNKEAWYKTFYDNYRGSASQLKIALDAAKAYIAACPADPHDQQRAFMQKFIEKLAASGSTSPITASTARTRSGATVQQGQVYQLRMAGIQFVVPKNWTVATTSEGDALLYFDKGALMMTFILTSEYAGTVAGLKEELARGVSSRTTSTNRFDKNGINFDCVNGEGSLHGKDVGWSICVLKAGNSPVVRYTFGFRDMINKHFAELASAHNSLMKF